LRSLQILQNFGCRAPEILLGLETYTEAIDMWSVGCIMAELLHHQPLFPAKTELGILELMAKLLGSPNERIWPVCPFCPRKTCPTPLLGMHHLVMSFFCLKQYSQGNLLATQRKICVRSASNKVLAWLSWFLCSLCSFSDHHAPRLFYLHQCVACYLAVLAERTPSPAYAGLTNV